MTKSGAVTNAPCKFPWKYEDDTQIYYGCANPSWSRVGDWCPTELDDDDKYVSGKWGVCPESCKKSKVNKKKPNDMECETSKECESDCCDKSEVPHHDKKCATYDGGRYMECYPPFA